MRRSSASCLNRPITARQYSCRAVFFNLFSVAEPWQMLTLLMEPQGAGPSAKPGGGSPVSSDAMTSFVLSQPWHDLYVKIFSFSRIII